ncbi:MAG: SOS response-associated peptidase [Bdellovibrionales bacterium]|nr:SOS response-associated peptidase [Bdellovibrionales bacterium]
MCGRFALSHAYFEKMMKELGIALPNEPSYHPHYNISPGQKHWMVYKENANLCAVQGVWGISPSWMRSGQLLFNAKIETVTEKSTFKKAYTLHRCAVPINGFFEWVKEGQVKQPYYFHRLNDEIFFLAGIYFIEKNAKHFVIMTTKANERMKPYHHRMPIVLTAKHTSDWLSAKALLERESFADVQGLLEARKVTTRVNSGKVDDPECIAPL